MPILDHMIACAVSCLVLRMNNEYSEPYLFEPATPVSRPQDDQMNPIFIIHSTLPTFRKSPLSDPGT